MSKSKLLAVVAALNTPKGRKVIVAAMVALATAVGLSLDPEVAESVLGVAVSVIMVLEQS